MSTTTPPEVSARLEFLLMTGVDYRVALDLAWAPRLIEPGILDTADLPTVVLPSPHTVYVVNALSALVPVVPKVLGSDGLLH